MGNLPSADSGTLAKGVYTGGCLWVGGRRAFRCDVGRFRDANMIKPCTAAMIAALTPLIWADLISDAEAAEIKVFSATAMKPVLAALTSEFERTSGHKLAIRYDPTIVVKSRKIGRAHV